MVFSDTDCADSWRAASHRDHRINLHIPELAKLDHETPAADAEFPSCPHPVSDAQPGAAAGALRNWYLRTLPDGLVGSALTIST